MPAYRQFAQMLSVFGLCLALIGCAQTQLAGHVASVAAPERPKGHYKVGAPYTIKGIQYVPKEDFTYDQTGIASWYGPGFHGKRTANGEIFDSNALTAAHPTLQMPSMVRVTNLENGRSVVLRVNDRGPFADNRIIDVSKRGSEVLGFRKQGTAMVRVEVLTEETLAVIPPKEAARVRYEGGLGGPAPTYAAVETPVSRPDAVPARRAAQPVAVAQASPAVRVPVPEPRPSAAQVASFQPSIAPLQPAPRPVVQPAAVQQWYVQTGAFVRYDNAKRLGTQLTSLGRVEIQALEHQGGAIYRVRMGPMQSQTEANMLAQAVSNAGINDLRVIVD